MFLMLMCSELSCYMVSCSKKICVGH
ncbi:hypothetical protein Gohar_004370 [Gossypium harknessii]|uniref:Uncharacterized protein n=1 Tax=Gossypium harknessii TaxID=34285 RepID=A0A7J9H4Q2_9ROSI|nr:hypothetical protein [Gossypium harknessii]